MHNLILRIKGRRAVKGEVRKIRRGRSKKLNFFLESSEESLSVYKDNGDLIILEKSPQSQRRNNASES